MNKLTLYIITGLPYAGKTTLTNELVKRSKFTVVSVDEAIDEGGYIVEQMTQKDWDAVYTRAYERLKKYLSEGKTVIFDEANLKRSERETARQIAEANNATPVLIYVKTPKEEIKRRWLENQKTKTRGHLEEKSLNLAFSLFEEPQPDENPIIYSQKMDLDKFISEDLFKFP